MAGACIVVGAGCVGLTTAVRLLEAGYKVLVVAENLPSDPLQARYASTAAGAHHLSFADNKDWRQRFLDQRTFDVFWQESQDEHVANKRGILRLTQTEYYTGDEKHIRFLEQLPDFKVLPSSARPAFADHSCSFTSFTVEPARYMPYLLERIAKLGGKVQRSPRFSRLEEALSYSPSAIAVVNCTGIGARDLAETKDLTVIPVRGQVLALNAPWVRTGWTRQVGSLSGGEGGQRTYIIPRASGEVIVGGTREANDWEESPRVETSDDILKRAQEICPLLATPPDRPALSDLRSLVKAEVVGFRPTRYAGIRLEVDERRLGDSIPLIHNYGHGGYGWQSCWASAEEAQRLVGEQVRSSSEYLRAKL